MANLDLREIILRAADRRFAELPPFDALAGISRGGLVWGACLADRRRIPMAVINFERRRSGLQRLVEGEIGGRCTVLVDNAVNSGDSLRQAARIAQDAGIRIVGALALIGLKEGPWELGFRVRTIWTIAEIHAVHTALAGPGP